MVAHYVQIFLRTKQEMKYCHVDLNSFTFLGATEFVFVSVVGLFVI